MSILWKFSRRVLTMRQRESPAERYHMYLAKRAHEADRIVCALLGIDVAPVWKETTEEYRTELLANVRQLYENPEQDLEGSLRYRMVRLCVLGPDVLGDFPEQEPTEMYKCGPQLVNAVERLVRNVIMGEGKAKTLQEWDRIRKTDWFERL